MPEAPVELALAELATPDFDVRRRGIRRLAADRSPEAVAALVDVLRSGVDAETRSQAAVFLGHTRSGSVIEPLLERLRFDPESSVRAGCLLGLDALYTFESERYDPGLVTPGILAALQDPEARVVRSACLACDTLELKAAIPTLVQLLGSPSLTIRRGVIRPLVNLGERGEALVAAVRDLLQNPGDDEQHWERSSLERTLAELEAETAPGEPPTPEARQEDELRQALVLMESEVGTERRKGADLLHRLGGPTAVERLKSALEDPEPGVRSRAAMALGTWKVREALPALIEHLTNDPSLHVRRLSGAFIHYFEQDRDQAVAGLLRALNDEDPGIVGGACTSLGLLGDRSVIPVLLRLLNREEWSVRQDAAWALVRLDAADQRLVAALERLLTEPEAVEHELSIQEMNASLDIQREMALEFGDPEPEAALTLSDLLERARELAGLTD